MNNPWKDMYINEYGETDPDYKLSKKSIRNYLPNVTPIIRKSCSHCGYMVAHPEEYVREIENFIAFLTELKASFIK